MIELVVDIQRACDNNSIPSDDDFFHWVGSAISACYSNEENGNFEVSVRIVSSEEMTELNNQFRQQPKPTNVLSFPADFPEELAIPLLGDIVICADVVEKEAEEQKKTLSAHWAHMTVHGTLHLLGYDHIIDAEAEEMESLETNILLALNYPAPY